jgi:hypothetical protein
VQHPAQISVLLAPLLWCLLLTLLLLGSLGDLLMCQVLQLLCKP